MRELLDKLTVPIPNEHTERLVQKAREHDVFIQSGSMLEEDPKWPGVVFNTTCLVGPEGLLYKYRKVNPWIPYEVHSSPHDLPGYDEPLFPVADTPIGRIGCAICYDWLFPEAMRQLAANGASSDSGVGVHGSVGRDRADELVDDHQPRARDREHRLRRRREPGREPSSLSAVLVARRIAGRRLRRPHGRRGVAGTGRADRRRADRRLGAAPRARSRAGTPHAGASAHRGLSGYARHALSAGADRARLASFEANQALIARAKREASFVEQEVESQEHFLPEEQKNS